jgi:hypothetical protein
VAILREADRDPIAAVTKHHRVSEQTMSDEWTREGLGHRGRRPHPLDFASRALLKWIVDHGIDTALIDPGRGEIQRQVPRRVPEPGVVPSRAEAKVVKESWRRHYNPVS